MAGHEAWVYVVGGTLRVMRRGRDGDIQTETIHLNARVVGRNLAEAERVMSQYARSWAHGLGYTVADLRVDGSGLPIGERVIVGGR